jgi:hypothetical protein
MACRWTKSPRSLFSIRTSTPEHIDTARIMCWSRLRTHEAEQPAMEMWPAVPLTRLSWFGPSNKSRLRCCVASRRGSAPSFQPRAEFCKD